MAAIVTFVFAMALAIGYAKDGWDFTGLWSTLWSLAVSIIALVLVESTRRLVIAIYGAVETSDAQDGGPTADRPTGSSSDGPEPGPDPGPGSIPWRRTTGDGLPREAVDLILREVGAIEDGDEVYVDDRRGRILVVREPDLLLLLVTPDGQLITLFSPLLPRRFNWSRDLLVVL